MTVQKSKNTSQHHFDEYLKYALFGLLSGDPNIIPSHLISRCLEIATLLDKAVEGRNESLRNAAGKLGVACTPKK